MRLPIPSFRAGPLAALPALVARVPGAALVRRHRSSIAVLLVAGLGTGMVQLGDAPVAAVPMAQAAAEEPAADDAAALEGTDTARRFLVVLHQPAPTTTTTTTTEPTTTTTAAPTTTAGAAETTRVSRPSSTTEPPAAPFRVTVLPTDETQQAVIARLDGSRLIVAVPTNYFTLVTDSAVVGPLTPGGTSPGRQLVRDRDGRYWEAELDAVPAVVHELAGQVAPEPTTSTTSTTVAHEVPTSAAMHDDHATTTTSHGEADADHEAATGTTTTTDLPSSPLPANVLGPVAPHDLEAVLALASLPGVRTVRPLGGGVVEVIGDIDADALAAVAGVERVVERAA